MKIDAKFEKVSFEQFKKDWKAKVCLPQSSQPGPHDTNILPDISILSDDKLRKIYDNIPLPTRATSGSAGYDFYIPYGCRFASESNTDSMILFPTGIKCKMPKDYFLMMVPRSSLGFKYGMRLINTCGVIDSDYYNNEDNEGHIMIKMVRDLSSMDVCHLKAGDKIAQAILIPYGTTSDDTTDANRSGGFGSTGK